MEKKIYQVDVQNSSPCVNGPTYFSLIENWDNQYLYINNINDNINNINNVQNCIIEINLENKFFDCDSLIENLYVQTTINSKKEELLIQKDKNITIRIKCANASLNGFKPERTITINNDTYYCYSTLFAYFEIYAKHGIDKNMYFLSNNVNDNKIYDYYIYINLSTENYSDFFIPYEFYNLTIDCHTFDFTHDKSNGTQNNEVTNVTIKESLVLKDISKVEFNNLKIEGVLSMDDNTELICKTLEL